MSLKSIKVVLIDDDENYKIVVNAVLKTCKFPYELSWYQNIDSLPPSIEGDLFLIDDRISGTEKSIEIIQTLLNSTIPNRIFVVTGHGSFKLLKILYDKGIGFIDKNDGPMGLVEKMKDFFEFETKRLTLSEKIADMESKVSELIQE